MDKEEIAPIIIGKLLNIGGMLKRNGDQLVSPFGLNQQQFSILFEIANEERVKQKNMVNKLVLEKPHVSKMVKKLVSMGLIEIEESPEDRRSPWLKITPEGRKKVALCKESVGSWNTEWADKITKEELTELMDHLTVMQRIFKEISGR